VYSYKLLQFNDFIQPADNMMCASSLGEGIGAILKVGAAILKRFGVVVNSTILLLVASIG